MLEQATCTVELAELDARLLGLRWWRTQRLQAIRSAPPGRRELLIGRVAEKFSSDCNLLLDRRLAVQT